jgi:pimeloyl-ACP methyl ester carboxylesterase
LERFLVNQVLGVFGRQVAVQVDGSGHPVVLLHGLGGTSKTWQQTIDCLGGSLLTVAIDLAGHGRSTRDRGDYSITANAVLVRGVLDQLGIDRALVVGHSYGGGVALAAAVIFPEKVAGLGLVAAGGLGHEAAPVLRAMSLPFVGELASLAIHPWLIDKIDATFNRLSAVGFHEPTEFLQKRQLLRSLSDMSARGSFLDTLRGVINLQGQQVNGAERLDQVGDIPVLVVWGDRDPMLPISHADVVTDALPHARVEIFEGAGHFPHAQDPGRLAHLLGEMASTAFDRR